MSVYAVIDDHGKVVNVIVAEAEFIATLPDLISNPDIHTGPLQVGHTYCDISEIEQAVGVGWVRAEDGTFSLDSAAEEAQNSAEIAAEESAARDTEFLEEVAAKVQAGEHLTQDERDRLTIIQLRR